MSDEELSRAREEIGRLTALAESNEWVIGQGAETISHLEAELAAARELIPKTYPQFPDVEDCDGISAGVSGPGSSREDDDT